MQQGTGHNRRLWGVLGLIGCLISVGCSSISKGDLSLDLGIKDRGVASWYGKDFHGRLAANGEVFDMTALTAAHRKLPLGSLVRVVNLVNGRHVDVRINDRGPYVGGRILDVSHAAAVELGMVESGVSIVHLEVIGRHRPLLPVKHEGHLKFLRGDLLLQIRDAKAGSLFDAETRVFPAGLRMPPPIERPFPPGILHERRERRSAAALLAGDHAPLPAVPGLLV